MKFFFDNLKTSKFFKTIMFCLIMLFNTIHLQKVSITQIKTWKSSKHSIKYMKTPKFSSITFHCTQKKMFFDIKTDIVVMLTFSVDKIFLRTIAVACFSCYTKKKKFQILSCGSSRMS